MTEQIESIESIETDAIERSKRMQIPPFMQLQNLNDYPPPLDISSFPTTFSKAQSIETENSSSPKLPSLKFNSKEIILGLDIAKTILKCEEVLQQNTKIFLNKINDQNETIIQLSKEEKKVLTEYLNQLSKKSNVDSAKRVLNLLTSSAAITTGILLLNPQSGAAILLATSGILNITINEIIPKFGGFEKIAGLLTNDLKKIQDLANNIQTLTSLTNFIVGITAAIEINPLVLNANSGTKIVNTILNIFGGITDFIKGLYEKDFKNIEANKTITDGKLKTEELKLEHSYLEFQSAQEFEIAFYKSCSAIIQTLNKISDNITA